MKIAETGRFLLGTGAMSDDETANVVDVVEWMPISARLHGLRTSPSDFRYLSLPSKGTPQATQEPQVWLEMICKAVREDTDAQHSTHIAVAYSLVNSEELRTNKVDVLHWTRDRRRINFINFREIPMIKKGRSKENILFDAWGTLEDTGSNHMGREVVVTVTIALPFTFPDGKEVFYAYGMQTFWEELVACSRKNDHNGLVVSHTTTSTTSTTLTTSSTSSTSSKRPCVAAAAEKALAAL